MKRISLIIGLLLILAPLWVGAQTALNMENETGRVWIPASGADAGKLHVNVDMFYYGNPGGILQKANAGNLRSIAAYVMGRDIIPISRGQINGASFSIIVPELNTSSYLRAAKDYFRVVDENAFISGKDVLLDTHIYFEALMNGNDGTWNFGLYNSNDIGPDLRFTRNGYYTFIYSTGEVIVKGTGTYNGVYDCHLTEGWNCIYYDLANNTWVTIPLPTNVVWVCHKLQ